MEQRKLRTTGFIIGGVLSIVLVIVGFSITQGVFTRASQLEPISVTITDLTSNSAKITWTSEDESQGVVEYGTSTTELTAFSPEAEKTRNHAVELTLLTPGTTYYFQLKVGDRKFDNEGIPWSFTTKSSDGDVTSVSDPTPTLSSSSQSLQNKLSNDPLKSTPTPVSSVRIPPQNSNNVLGCPETTCDKIKANLASNGGCTVKDYIQCIKK